MLNSVHRLKSVPSVGETVHISVFEVQKVKQTASKGVVWLSFLCSTRITRKKSAPSNGVNRVSPPPFLAAFWIKSKIALSPLLILFRNLNC